MRTIRVLVVLNVVVDELVVVPMCVVPADRVETLLPFSSREQNKTNETFIYNNDPRTYEILLTCQSAFSTKCLYEYMYTSIVCNRPTLKE